MVKVACTIVNGIVIQKWKTGYDDGTGDGVKFPVKDGIALRLNGPSARHAGVGNTEGVGQAAAITEVPDDWGFDRWLEANKLNPFVAEGMISKVEDEAPADPNAR